MYLRKLDTAILIFSCVGSKLYAYMHILGVVLIAVVLLTGVYFTGPKSNSNQATQPLLSSGQVQTLPINSPTPENKENMVTIRNKKTGETKQVTQSQVSNYTQVTQQPKAVQPSENALKLSAYVFASSNEKQRNDLISKFSNGTNDLKEAVKKLAVLLDSKPEAIALIEKTIAQDIANKKSISDREAIGEYHQKEYEKLKAEIDSIPKITNNTYTGGIQNTNRYTDNTSNSPNAPVVNTYKGPTSYTSIGKTVYGSDGSTYNQIGNTVYKNDGTTYTAIGNRVYGSNGSTYSSIGRTVYDNNGTFYNRIGNTVYGTDGSTATSIGNTIYTQPGY